VFFIMRWFWIDRFEKFVVGQEAVGVKNVTFGEEPVDDYLPGLCHYPHSLMIEGMAQAGGLVLSSRGDFHPKIVLAKVSKAIFHFVAEPGDQLVFTAKVASIQPDGAVVEGTIDVAGKRLADMELTFAILDDSFGRESFFMPGDLLRVLRCMRLFDVSVYPDGSRYGIPAYMAEAEKLEYIPISYSPLGKLGTSA
jgi:3-hydroxyacyl-[acyl-carrier-protein] dehydratase